MEWLFNPEVLFVIAVLGMLSHYLKKKVRGEDLVDIATYFKTHLKSLLLSSIATAIGYASYMSLLARGDLGDVLTVFAIGYMSDSFFNKWGNKIEP